MQQRDSRLVKDIVFIVIVKLLAISALWWYFVRDARISIDAPSAADHMGVVALPAKPSSGNPHD